MVHSLNSQGLVQIVEAGVPFVDPAVQFGAAGAFETLRVEARRLHLFKLHWARLRRTLTFLQYPADPDRERVLDLIAAELNLFPPESNLRIRLTAGLEPGLSSKQPSSLRIFAEARPLDPEIVRPVSQRPPLSLHLLPDYGISVSDPWNGHKTTRYFAYAEARRRARLRGFDEALFLNDFGNVVEASAHNIFWIKDSHLFSPPGDAGGLPGTFASHLRNLALGLGIEHRTANAWIGEVRSAETLFLTNSIGEIRQVSVLDDLEILPLGETPIGAQLLRIVEDDRRLRGDVDLSGPG